MMHFIRTPQMLLLLFFLFGGIADVWGVRVKDIANLRGARDNQLTGMGIVVGLDGSGDSPGSLLSRKPVVNALERLGIRVNQSDINGRSIAAVWIIATLPPFAKSGQKIDVTVATLGDATSLRGGILLMSLLRAANRLVYAAAQGPIVGIPRGVSTRFLDQVSGQVPLPFNSSMVASVGRIPGGALVEREINLNLNSRSRVYFNLKSPDFTTANRLEKLINRALGYQSSRAKDAGTVEIAVPQSYLGKTVELISYIENLEITPDNSAKVVLDERTGTIVIGQGVRIDPISISQGSLNIEVKIPNLPPPPQGEQANAPVRGNVVLLKGGTDLKEIVDGFNKIGASSEELVQILKAIKSAGALHAELLIK